MQMAYKTSGKTVGHAVRTLSPDGGTLTVTTTMIESSSTNPVRVDHYRRTSPSIGFGGAWLNMDGPAQRPSLLVIRMTDLILHLSFPGTTQKTDILLNGSDAPMQGLPSGVHATLYARKYEGDGLLVEQKVELSVTTKGRHASALCHYVRNKSYVVCILM
jgi:hypothetical protein